MGAPATVRKPSRWPAVAAAARGNPASRLLLLPFALVVVTPGAQEPCPRRGTELATATKGAIVSFTRSLALQVVARGIRVNGVAPGPIWTPLIPSTFTTEEVAKFGEDTPMGRPGQPFEVAAGFVFLASYAASYVTGQVLHINGGEVING